MSPGKQLAGHVTGEQVIDRIAVPVAAGTIAVAAEREEEPYAWNLVIPITRIGVLPCPPAAGRGRQPDLAVSTGR